MNREQIEILLKAIEDIYFLTPLRKNDWDKDVDNLVYQLNLKKD